VNNGHKQILVYADNIPKGFSIGCLPFTDEHKLALSNAHKNMSEETKQIRNRKIS
jgi:hypothetical protein